MQLFRELQKKFKYCILNTRDVIVVKFLTDNTLYEVKSKQTLCEYIVNLAGETSVVASGSSTYLYLSCCTNSRDIHVATLLL